LYALRDGHSSTPGLVPATPSLLRALDRVSRAQVEAYSGGTTSGSTGGVSSEAHDNYISNINSVEPAQRGKDRWRGFWDEVQQKAAAP
jgi:hypothetical protein